MADPVNWSKLRKQAIDLVALDLPSNAALRHVLVVLTGALIFFGCALAAVLKTHSQGIDESKKTAKLAVAAPPAPPPAAKQPQPAGSYAARMSEARRVEEILAQAARRVSSGDVIGARDMLAVAAAEDGPQGPVTFGLAETYDPNMLSAWGSRGVVSNVVRAKELYRKALELGVTKANTRLEALK